MNFNFAINLNDIAHKFSPKAANVCAACNGAFTGPEQARFPIVTNKDGIALYLTLCMRCAQKRVTRTYEMSLTE